MGQAEKPVIGKIKKKEEEEKLTGLRTMPGKGKGHWVWYS